MLDHAAGPGSFRFRKKERLKGRDEISAAFRRGRRLADQGLKLFVLANGLPHNRFAVTFSRKFGNAVERNRARRVSREAYRHLSRGLKAGYDLVLLVYPGDGFFPLRLKQLEALFSRAGLFVMD
jgi:ribonuclease P protein component